MTRTQGRSQSAFALTATIVMFVAMAHAQTYSVLYNFGSQTGDPKFPFYSGAIAQGTDGNLYATSGGGGANNAGAVFRISPAGALKVLYSFCSQTNCVDGEGPSSGLTLRPDGHFVGTTTSGGTGSCILGGCGTIFDISPTGSLTTLYNFKSSTDGTAPTSPPIVGADGSFYGTTQLGGSNANCGTLYRLTGNTYTVLHIFDHTHGCGPGPLALGTDGNLYGTASNGDGAGVFFRLTLQPGKAALYTVLHAFDGFDGTNPSIIGAPVQASDGNFYGTTDESISNGSGIIYKMTPTGTETVLYTLNGSTDGEFPTSGLTLASDGNFYGVVNLGGTGSDCKSPRDNTCGTLFRVTPTGTFSVVHDFDFTTGANPYDKPFQNTNGQLYGETVGGGTGTDPSCPKGDDVGCGVFYSWSAGLPAFVSPITFMGKVGSLVEILGQGFTSATTVSFNGVPATAAVVSGTYLHTTVPIGATTGLITVTTSGTTLTSNRQFTVTP